MRIAVAYRPMTAVAGDFYEFIPVDRKRVGFLVATSPDTAFQPHSSLR